MDPTTPAAHTGDHSDHGPHRSSPPVAAISLALAQSRASALSLGDVAVLARTCRALKSASERALVRSVSILPRAWSGGGAGEAEGSECVRLYSASAVDSFAKFAERWGVKEGDNSSEELVEELRAAGSDSGEDTADRLASDDNPTLRPRQLALHLHQLSSPASLLKILHSCASTLTHLRITYAEHLLAHDKRIYAALASLSRLTSLIIHCVGPRSCAFLKTLQARLEHVEVEFADDWVHSVLCAPLSQPDVPHLFEFAGGLPTPIPTPAASPAAPEAEDAEGLPDPISLLAHSMPTLRTLRASNAIIVTVADKLRYPRVKTLALRLAGVPTVTPLVHAFPALAELYVYTPFDGCGLRAPSLPDSEEEEGKQKKQKEKKKGEERQGEEVGKRRLRAPMPSIHATRSANRTSQLYSSFPPLACVRGFVPGLYALGLTCTVRHVEIGRLAPPSEGTEEARAVREILSDAKPTSVTIGLGRGWWAEGRMTVVEQESGKERGKRRRKSGEKEEQRKKAKVKEESGVCGARRRRKDKEAAQDALTSIFGGNMAEDEVWAGVTDLVLRVEEPGNWKHVTRDILAMLLPLTNTLATFVLHWDRTSVPFDRIPHDDGYEDPDGDVPMYSDAYPLNDRTSLSRSRIEAFARYAGEQHPALRYALIKILHDDPSRPLALTPEATPWSAPPQPPTPPTVRQPAAPLCESRFFRIERSQGWLCLDTLPAGVAERVMAGEGLSFADRVRYY